MNCGNLGEECGRRDFPGDTNNIHCLTSIEFLKYIHVLMVKQIQYLMYPCIAATFLTRIHIIAPFVFEFFDSTLSH